MTAASDERPEAREVSCCECGADLTHKNATYVDSLRAWRCFPSCERPEAAPTGASEQAIREDRRARECIAEGCIWYRHANALSADVTRLDDELRATRERIASLELTLKECKDLARIVTNELVERANAGPTPPTEEPT